MDHESTAKGRSGTWLIVGILVLAVGAAMFAWWFRAQATRRVMALWGAERAVVIQNGEPVFAFRLAVPAAGEPTPDEPIEVWGQPLAMTERVDISRSRGLLHLRQALLEDRSFLGKIDEHRGELDASRWVYGLQIGDGEQVVLLVFTEEFDRLMLVDSDAKSPHAAIPVAVARPVAKGLATFFAEQFDASTAAAEATE